MRKSWKTPQILKIKSPPRYSDVSCALNTSWIMISSPHITKRDTLSTSRRSSAIRKTSNLWIIYLKNYMELIVIMVNSMRRTLSWSWRRRWSTSSKRTSWNCTRRLPISRRPRNWRRCRIYSSVIKRSSSSRAKMCRRLLKPTRLWLKTSKIKLLVNYKPKSKD